MTSLTVEEQTANRRGARSLAHELSSFFTKAQLVTSNYTHDGANFSLTSSNGLAGDDLYKVVKEYFPHAQGEVAAKSVTINYSELIKDAQQYQRGLEAIANIKNQADFGSAIVRKAMEDVGSKLRFAQGTNANVSFYNDAGTRKASFSAIIEDGNIESMKVVMSNYKNIEAKVGERISALLKEAGLPQDAIKHRPSIVSENASGLNREYGILTSQVTNNGKFSGLKLSSDISFDVNPNIEITPAQIKKIQELTVGKAPNAEAVTVASVIGMKGVSKNLSDIDLLAAALKEHCRQEGYPDCKTFISNDSEGKRTKVNIDVPQKYLENMPVSYAFTSKAEELSVNLIRSFSEKHLERNSGEKSQSFIKDAKGKNKIDAFGAHLKLNAPLSETDKDAISRAANKSFSLGI